MFDIDKIKIIIKNFAENNNFLQQIDIENFEKLDFDRQNYIKIDNKKFICLNENKLKSNIEIIFGKIVVEIDSIDEEEWYFIEKNIFFNINVIDYQNEEILLESIINECKNHKFL